MEVEQVAQGDVQAVHTVAEVRKKPELHAVQILNALQVEQFDIQPEHVLQVLPLG